MAVERQRESATVAALATTGIRTKVRENIGDILTFSLLLHVGNVVPAFALDCAMYGW
jgi:hypothetical protein